MDDGDKNGILKILSEERETITAYNNVNTRWMDSQTVRDIMETHLEDIIEGAAAKSLEESCSVDK